MGTGDGEAGVSAGAATSAAPSSTGFREGDGTTIRFNASGCTKANFQDGGGEAWQPDDWLCVQVGDGDWFAYVFEGGASSTAVELRLRATAAAANGGEGCRLTAHIDGALALTAEPADGDWRVFAAERPLPIGAGSHRLVIRGAGGAGWLEWLELVEVEGE